jgi:hypothetical protein
MDPIVVPAVEPPPFDPNNIPDELDNLDGVPERLRGVFEKTDSGKFKLADLSGLRKSRDTTLKEKKALAAKLDSMKAKGIDPDKIDALAEALDLEELLQLKRDKAEKAAKPQEADPAIPQHLLDKMTQDRARDIEKERAKTAAVEAERDKARLDLVAYKLEGKVRREAIKAGVIESEVDDTLILTRKFFKQSEDGEKVIVLDADGDPTDMSLEKFWTDHYKSLKPRVYKSNETGGSGSTANQVNGKLGGAAFQGLLPTERLKRARAANIR